MIDIKKLQDGLDKGKWLNHGTSLELLKELEDARAEIEKLKAEIATNWETGQAIFEQQKDEIEKLRAFVRAYDKMRTDCQTKDLMWPQFKDSDETRAALGDV